MNQNTTHKFAIGLNKTLEPGVAMNAAAHIALAMVAKATEEQRKQMQFIDYIDADGIIHPSSALSLIILRGSGGDLRKFRQGALESGLLCIDFLQTMTGDTYKEQLERTRQIKTEELVYYGVGIFGEIEKVNVLTKKLSLWK